jgi:hypothetical protein
VGGAVDLIRVRPISGGSDRQASMLIGRIAQCLIDEGLDRHDAILHAIGMVLAENYDRTARVERDVVP